jgi:hypothetical protein
MYTYKSTIVDNFVTANIVKTRMNIIEKRFLASFQALRCRPRRLLPAVGTTVFAAVSVPLLVDRPSGETSDQDGLYCRYFLYISFSNGM